MKITSVEVFRVKCDLEGVPSWAPIVVKINTDEGICGFGEVGVSYGIGQTAGWGMAKDLAAIIIGMDTMNVEAIWNKMQKRTLWGQGGGTMVSAGMSGIDAAIWDIRGKAMGVPVYQLLGGKTNKYLRTYASQIQFGWGPDSSGRESLIDPKDYAKAARAAVIEGFDCVKVDPIGLDDNGVWLGWDTTKMLSHKQMKLCRARLEAIREEIGPDNDIIVEMHSFPDTTTAIQFGRFIEDLNIFYYEEPVQPLNPKMMKEVKNNVKMPIASGERIYTRWGYRPFLEDRSLDVIQPDFGNMGGITEGKKVCDMAHVYDISVQGHVCGGPIATAMAMHIEAVIPNFIIHELHRYAILKNNIDTCKYDYMPVNGRYEVPDIPGIGQELTDEAMETSEKIIVK